MKHYRLSKSILIEYMNIPILFSSISLLVMPSWHQEQSQHKNTAVTEFLFY